MKTAKRIAAVCVTAVMVFQMLAPSTDVLSQEVSAVTGVASAIAYGASSATDGAQGEESAGGENGNGAASDGESAGSPDAGAKPSESDGAAAADKSEGETRDPASNDASSVGDAVADVAASVSGDEDASGKDADSDVSSEEVDVQAASEYKINSVEELKNALGDGKVTANGDAATKIKFGTDKDLLVISNTKPEIYQAASIEKSGLTGVSFDLSKAVDGYEFMGFGSAEVPFGGTFSPAGVPITLNKSLFNNIKLSADASLNLVWKGSDSQPVIASQIDGNSRILSTIVSVANPYSASDSSKVMLTAPLLGTVAGSLTLETTYQTESNKPLAINVQSSSDNIGLLANTVDAKASFTVGKIEGIPDSYEGTPTITTTKDGANAGGLIGECGDGATVAVNKGVDISQFAVYGKNASGGFIGKGTNLTLRIGSDAFVKPARVVGNANSSYSGGIVGDVRFAGGYTVSPSDFTFDDVVTLGARYRAGCLFGKTDISNGDIVVQGGTYKSQLTSGDDGKQSTDYSRGSYGGLVGNVFATSKGDNDALRALVVQSDNNDKVSVEFNHASALCYAGGVAGYVGDKTASKAQLQLQPVAVVLDGVFVACKGEASARQSNGRYGGAVGVVDMNDVLDVRDFALTSESKIGAVSQYRSAGIAGSAWIAIIKFSGITDLSGAIFAENATTGQLVNENYNSLIFADGSGSNGTIATDGAATGWTLKRSNTASKTDDLATYGEVLRLGEDGLSSNLLKLDSGTHILTKAESLARNGNACTLADKNDFAKLAITWQTNGYYSMAQGVSHSADDAEDGLGNLTSSTIAVNSTIDLSGTGLTGLTKDRVPPTAKWEGGAESSQLFSGKLTGNGTIDLAVGEPYGMRGNDAIGSDDTTAGNGKIYRHGRLGLFGGVTTNAAIENVAIGGFMKFENGGAIDAGAVTGTIAGNSTFSGVKVTTNIAYTSSNDGNVLQVGGIAGSVSAAATVDFTNGTEAKAAIAANGSAQGETRIGGAIGYVAADATSTLNVSSLKIGGAINAESESKKVAQIGGFIGSIGQGAAGVLKTVSITGLAFDGFQMSVGKNGDTKNGAGGLLGYSWGNATVAIGDDANNDDSAYALTTNNTSITANSAAEFGGLLYAMSGHLVIQNRALDLSNAVLSATSATSFGVLLAYGSTSANNTTFGVETYTGLYLEDKTPWDIAYKVANGDKSLKIEADNNKVTCFDEWVAVAAKPGSTTSDNGCNGVVSLHTEADTLNMTGNPESDNSYRNRTKFGESHQTNANTRYYYNLDRCWAAASGQIRSYNLTTPEGLMVWNLLWYAPTTLDEYMFPGVNYNQYWPVTIGSGNGAASIISLEGYSYYPTNINCGVSIKNVTIRFCYSQIKQEQANNKTNYKTERDSATQHTNMHAALIRTYSGTNTRTLSLEDVCLTGSTGIMVKDSRASSVSGALVCRLAYGTSTSPTSISINRLVLDGLKVDGVDAEGKTYAPLLINEMPNYITLDVKGLSVKKGSYGDDGKMGIAASSLFGRLGGIGTGNTLVNASLSNGVAVPSRKEAGYTIFSRASFFESFAYGANLSGSASYIFNQGDAVTYGKEIDSKGEYPNKQLWYYDASGYGSPSGPGFVTDGSVTAEFEEYNKFANYLPYVYTRHEDGKNYHEVKVNQRAADLVKGCGTYSDPYSVQTEQEIYSLTNYINDANSVVDGWQVTITSDQSQVCDRRANGAASYEATYKVSVSNNRTWTKVKGPDKASATLDNSVMHRYLQSAYYYIDPASGNKKIELDAGAFNGFGSLTNPFRGVIVGKIGDGDTNNALEIEASGSANKPSYGLIPYSYGSVVRNLSISYSGTNTIGYKSKDTTNGTPGSFFGGVIGCIMGGDNIVDGVNVTGENCTLSASGGKSYLVPMGGYIGAICGGGVIFRNMGSETSWRSLTKDTGSLYDNPYVGRVIDGYAFSEGCTVDNGNDDYKVNQLDTAKRGCVTTKNTEMAYSWEVNGVQKGAATVSIQNSQGLMILSAIINSGAGAGAAHTSSAESGKGVYRGSRAYEGRAVKALDMQVSNKTTGYYFGNEQYGKVRNASYASVGDGGISSSNSEWATAKMDDQRAPGYQDWKGPLDATQRQADAGEINSPYLVKKYANWATGEVCAMGITGLVIEFAQNLTFDMRGYGSAYRGLSGRYFSNACVTANMDAGYKYWQYITPSIACIKGNGATITVTNNFKEYTDDDFKVSGLGALFDNVMFKTASYLNDAITQNNNSNVDNLSFASCDLSIDYVNGTSSDKRTVMTNQNDGTKEIGVGCLAGVTTNQNDQGDFGIYKNVSVDSCNVRGGASAGGLIGTVGYRAICGTYDGSSSRMTQGSGSPSVPVRLVDCKYQNCDISAEANAGGFVGKQANSVFSANVGEGDGFFGQSSTVRATSRWNGGECCTAGGLLGLTAADVQIGKTTTSAKPLMLTDVVVTSDKTDGTFANTRGIGGILGRAEHVVSVKHVSISSTKNAGDNDATYIGSKNAAANRSNDDEGNNRYGSAGGIGGIVGTAANGDVAVDDCRVSSVLFAVRECAGGIFGTIADGKTLTATNIVVDSIQIDGAYSAGVLGQAKGNSNTTIVANAVVKNSTFKKKANWWNHPEGHNTYSGGIVGDTKGAIKMSNILVSKNTFKDKQYQGLLFGDVPPSEEGGGGVTGIYVAGLNVELKEGEKNTDTPNLMHYRKASVVGAVNKKSYIAFGDYNGTNRNETMAGKDGSILYNDERDDSGNMPAVESASPYVATSPVSSLQVRAAKDADAKSVFSDGAASYVDGDGKTKLLAGKIANEATAGSSSDGKYTYTNIGGIDKDGNYQNSASYNPQTADSTFNANNTAVGSNRVDDGADFPVLLIPGNDTTTVESYLNVVTNGGFSDARRLNGSSKSSDSHVTATAETFELQEIGEEGNKTKAFVKAAGSPSLSVVSDGTSSMAFRASSDWDNEKSRFTLLTVTFNEASGSYKVQVPIIVKRMLEIDFTATYSEGTNFKAAEYDTFGKHVLISGGEAMTGYLTWTYNQALGTPTEYGWNTHLASGGAMKPLNKTIEFKGTDAKGTLPRGTQLTLVDTAHGSKEYHCTVGYDDVSGASVKLTQFKDAEDHAYEEQWLSETAGVTATEDTSGAWVKLSKQDDNAQAGVKVSAGDNQGYYRQKTAADTEGTFYTLTVSDEAPKSENFYLIVRTPKDISTSVNGYTATSVTTTVNTNINYKLRVKDKNGNLQDGQQNTASTYSVASNYKHNLVDNLAIGTKQVAMVGTTYPLNMNVSDTITFGAQEYTDSDTLYYQLDSSLVNYKTSNGTASIESAAGYPTGTQGTYAFYVTVGGNYYTWDADSHAWAPAGTNETAAVEGLSWKANKGDMSLVLADAAGIPIDLSGIRKLAEQNKAKGANDATFTITMKADLTMAEPACQAGIVASQNGESYTKPNYRAYLSTHSDLLSTSSNSAYNPGNAGYYRKDLGSSTISLNASKLTQLGINVNDLQSADGTIALVGTYDFSKLAGGDAKLASGTTVTYTLSLQQRNDDGTYDAVEGIDNYITILNSDFLGTGALSGDGNNYVFADTKENGAFKTQAESLKLQNAFRVKANANVEGNEQTYANYRLVLTAQLSGGGVEDTPVNADNLTGYEHSDYVTYTLSKIKTDGIPHEGSTTSN